MKLFQIPLEPAYPMAFQAVSGPPNSSPNWQGFGCNKFRDVQEKGIYSYLGSSERLANGMRGLGGGDPLGENRALALSTMRDTPSMVQKLLEEEREAVKSALQAVDEHMQLKKKEVEDVHRKLMKDEPIKDHFKATFSMDILKTTSRNSRVSSSYTPVYNPQPVKIQPQKPVFLEAIYEEDSGSLSCNKSEKPQRIRHSAMPTRNATARSRSSIKDKVTSARPRVSEMSVLPPIDNGWSNMLTDGTYTGPLNYRWQRVADNYIDSDVRVRSRRRCQSRLLETRIRFGYEEENEDETEDEMRIPRKRQIGPPHTTTYSRWFSHYNPNHKE